MHYKDSIKQDCRDLILKSDSGLPKFRRIMAALEKPEVYLAYFKEAMDRGFGKSEGFLDITTHDDTDRPSTDTLIQTISALRSELDSLRAGTSLAAKE